MSSYPAMHGATYDDVLAAPPDVVAELVDGNLYTSPRPATPHLRANTNLTSFLNMRFDWGDRGPGGWWIIAEPELHAGGRVGRPDLALVPDIVGWRRARLPELPETKAFTVWPDWICEVISPSTGRLDRLEKMPKYAQQGVSHAWLIDARERLLEVYRLVEGFWMQLAVFGGDDVVRAEPFEAVELPLGALWLPPAATAPDPRS